MIAVLEITENAVKLSKALARKHGPIGLAIRAAELLIVLKKAMACTGDFPLPDWYMEAEKIVARTEPD